MDHSSKKMLTVSVEYEFDPDIASQQQIDSLIELLSEVAMHKRGLKGYTIFDGKMTKSVDFENALEFNYDEYESESGVPW